MSKETAEYVAAYIRYELERDPDPFYEKLTAELVIEAINAFEAGVPARS